LPSSRNRLPNSGASRGPRLLVSSEIFRSPIAMRLSVDRPSMGAPGTAVASAAGLGHAAPDIFASAVGSGFNLLVTDHTALGLAATDDLDALDPIGGAGALFSLGAGNSAGLSGADILGAGGPAPVVVVSSVLLGLCFSDDIDALQVDSSPRTSTTRWRRDHRRWLRVPSAWLAVPWRISSSHRVEALASQSSLLRAVLSGSCPPTTSPRSRSRRFRSRARRRCSVVPCC
jgi:hypothetical protein